MNLPKKYDAIISAINMDAIYYVVRKKYRFGASTEMNYVTKIIY